VEALPFTVWRDCITGMIGITDFEDNNHIFNLRKLRSIQDKLAHFECEYPKLKEATTLLELALWKLRMNAHSHTGMNIRHQKKRTPMKQVFEDRVVLPVGLMLSLGMCCRF
jgi:hypothetical protein